MYRLVILGLYLIVSFSICAQSSSKIYGTVINQVSQPVAGANLHILNTHFGTSTDSKGSFHLEIFQEGKYVLQVTAVGYASRTLDINASRDSLVIILNEISVQLDQVVVTAQKWEEEEKKIPISMTTLGENQIHDFRLWDSESLSGIIPNLFTSNSGDQRNVTSIRGIVTTSYDPAVSTYIDGVNQFSLDTYIGQLVNVSQIEVLRGPQSTLYGRNAMGGVINIITSTKSNEPFGFMEASMGNAGLQRYVVNSYVPLIPHKLGFEFGLLFEKNDGFFYNDFNNTSFDKNNIFYGNVLINYNINPALRLTVTVKQNQNKNHGSFPLAADPEEALTNPFRLSQNTLTVLRDNVFNSSISLTYAGKTMNFTSTSAYQSNYRYYESPIDADFSPFDIVSIHNNYGRDWNYVKVFTQEIKFSSPGKNTPFKWTTGVYGYTQNNPVKQATQFGMDAGFAGLPPSTDMINTSTGNNQGVALFGQSNYRIKNFEFALGLRLDREQRKQQVRGEMVQEPDPKPILIQADTSAVQWYTAFSPKVSISYLIDNGLIYSTYSKGFRTGGFTPFSGNDSEPPLFAYLPEHSHSGEIGFKKTSPSKRFSVNASAFLIALQDVQVPTLVLPEAYTITKNTGKLISSGFELEMKAKFRYGWQSLYNLGYTSAHYKSLSLAQEGNAVDLSNNKQIFTPVFTSCLVIQHRVPLNKKSWVITSRGEWLSFGEQFFDLKNLIRQSPYHLLNARLSLTLPQWELIGWIRNITNKHYIAYAYDFGATHLGDPRTYGITLKRFF